MELADAAVADLRQLEIWLQEETLDELEQLTVRPPARRIAGGDLVHDFVRIRDTQIYYVFLRMALVRTSGVLRVKSIGIFVRPKQA